ncbi:MAG: hypothetical protein QW128_05210 [Thermoprotei archaeon]
MNKNTEFFSRFMSSKTVVSLILFWILYTLSHGAYESLPYVLKSLSPEDMEFLGFLVLFSEMGIMASFIALIVNVFQHSYSRRARRLTIIAVIAIIMLFFIYYVNTYAYSYENRAVIIVNTKLPYVCGSEVFQPAIIRIIIGVNNTITWKNVSPFTQSIISMNNSFSSGPIPPGGEWSYTFTKPGIYKYRNGFYPWVQGTIIVDEA